MTGAVGTTRLAVDAFKRAGADNDVDTVDPVSSRQSPEPRSHHRTNGVKVRCRKQGDLLRPTCGLYRHDRAIRSSDNCIHRPGQTDPPCS